MTSSVQHTDSGATGIAQSTPSLQTPISGTTQKLRYIDAETAVKIDEQLLSEEGGFSIDQLMELAGLSCAQTVFACYPPLTFGTVLVAAGPGNQGGDGLVAARHLSHFGYRVMVWYPKEGKTELFKRLKRQLKNLNVDFVDTDEFDDALEESDVVLDAIFGFSFKGEPREPFKEPLDALNNDSRMEFEARRKVPPIISIDIPSGWNVDQGNQDGKRFTPQVILSLTAPKHGIKSFTLGPEKIGRHFLGGRFVSDEIEEKFALALPVYPGDAQIVDVTGYGEMTPEEAKQKLEEESKESVKASEQRAREARGAGDV
jgi:NAD(P)H-hydrate epimerase